ncbi:MAG: hypothetical protein IJF83_03265 [Methanobrevibacter sp.]|nr:hypothetical protein [Methanobrevibacter sp.]
MVRFKISYTIDKNLKPEEVDVDKHKEVKITDLTGVLPDLVVADENVARKYIECFNQPKKEAAINQTFKFIKGELDRVDDMNSKLIKPEETVYYTDTDDGEPVYHMSLKDRLFFDGYHANVRESRKRVDGYLEELQRILLE